MELEKRRESFVFYRSFADTINLLPPEMQLPLYKAITLYALDLNEPSFDDCILRAIWTGIKPQLDANHKRYLNGCGGAGYGILGGAPKGNQNAKKKQPQNNPKTTPNVNENENKNKNENDNGNGKFNPPSLQDISSYAHSIGSNTDIEKFHDHYSSIGWKDRNGNPIMDWRALFRVWIKNDKPQEKQPKVISGAEIFNIYK